MEMRKYVLFKVLIGLFVFSLCGFLMRVIAPAIPTVAALMGVVFFVLTLVIGVIIWRMRTSVWMEMAAAADGEVARQKEDSKLEE